MIKYVVIDLSKLDGDKLGEMLTEAYQQGYKDANSSSTSVGYETSPWMTIPSLTIGKSTTNAVETAPCFLTAAAFNSVTEAIDSAMNSTASKS